VFRNCHLLSVVVHAREENSSCLANSLISYSSRSWYRKRVASDEIGGITFSPPLHCCLHCRHGNPLLHTSVTVTVSSHPLCRWSGLHPLCRWSGLHPLCRWSGLHPLCRQSGLHPLCRQEDFISCVSVDLVNNCMYSFLLYILL